MLIEAHNPREIGFVRRVGFIELLDYRQIAQRIVGSYHFPTHALGLNFGRSECSFVVLHSHVGILVGVFQIARFQVVVGQIIGCQSALVGHISK